MNEMRETEGELVKDFEDENLLGNKITKSNKRIKIILIFIILLILIIIAIILFFTVFKKDTESNSDDPRELDTISSEELNKARNSFKQFRFNDTIDKEKFIPYNLFIPKNYTNNKKYPLIIFIGDGSTVGKEVKFPLTETIGGPIWATDTVQKKHESFVLVPEYSEIIIDDRNGYSKSEYINVTIRLILNLLKEYNIDSNRIYGTGQSMGAMTTLYLLANNLTLFAAGLIVDGQWKIDELQGLTNSTFTYFAAGGDDKALNGQNEVKKFLDSKNITYGFLDDINAQEKVEILNNETSKMYELGYQHNFITYIKGSVFPSNSKSMNEHMASFKYGYRIEIVRDWIFKQNKVKCPNGLYYSQDGKCAFTNFCAISKNDNSCKQCIYGYYLSSDRASCINDKNCYSGDKETGLCYSCTDDYYLDIQEKNCKSNLDNEKYKFCKFVDKDICIECDKFYYLAEDKKCSISPNCSLSNNSLCIKCMEGFNLGLDHKCINIEKCIYSRNSECTECIDGYYYDRFDRICKEATNNFINCKINTYYDQNQCEGCKNNYYLNQADYLCYTNTEKGPFYKCARSNNKGDLCQICVEGYFIGQYDSNCSKIEGCLMSLNENTCLQCDKYYCIDNSGNCTDNYYVIDESKKYYYRCNILNEMETGCEECDFGLNATENAQSITNPLT